MEIFIFMIGLKTLQSPRQCTDFYRNNKELVAKRDEYERYFHLFQWFGYNCHTLCSLTDGWIPNAGSHINNQITKPNLFLPRVFVSMERFICNRNLKRPLGVVRTKGSLSRITFECFQLDGYSHSIVHFQKLFFYN